MIFKMENNYKKEAMKTIIFLILLLLGFISYSQTYILDNTFGNSGIMQYNQGLFHVKNGLLINNNYYFISNNTIAKVGYNGQIATTFGTNGYKELQQTNETLTIKNFTFYNNFFYVYGLVKNNTTNNEDIYICKIDENGNYDSSFGTNGIVKLDFGLQENISSLTTESSGNLYCIGSRYSQGVLHSSRLIIFKIDNNNGSVNTLFNSAGFQEISLNLSTAGAKIIPYDNEYLLLGTTAKFEETYYKIKVMITKVDSNGYIDTTFGDNGFKIIPHVNPAVYNTVNDAELLNNTLYIDMTEGGGSLGDNSDNLLIYNLVSSQATLSTINNQFFFHKVTDDGVLTTSYCYSCCGTYYYACNNTFELRKMNLDGSINPNFHINGLYSYEFAYPQPLPNVTFGGDSRSYLFITEPNGKILIAGFVYNQGSTPGFSAIRILEGTLGLNSIDLYNEDSFFPNPFINDIIFKNTTPIKKVEVYDLIGRIITEPSFQYENDHNSIDLSNLIEKGTYLLRITTEKNEIITKKIIKK
jgi:Secretion system C-terminal sorting domain